MFVIRKVSFNKGMKTTYPSDKSSRPLFQFGMRKSRERGCLKLNKTKDQKCQINHNTSVFLLSAVLHTQGEDLRDGEGCLYSQRMERYMCSYGCHLGCTKGKAKSRRRQHEVEFREKRKEVSTDFWLTRS